MLIKNLYFQENETRLLLNTQQIKRFCSEGIRKGMTMEGLLALYKYVICDREKVGKIQWAAQMQPVEFPTITSVPSISPITGDNEDSNWHAVRCDQVTSISYQPFGACFVQSCNDESSLIVAEYSRKCLTFFDVGTGSVKRQITPDGGKFLPKCVVPLPVSDFDFAVTDDFEKQIKLISCATDDPLSRSVVQRYKLRGPSGLDLVPGHNDFIVCDIEAKSLHRITLEGRFVWSAADNQTFAYPEFVVVDQRNRILVSDQRANLVKIFDIDGKQLGQFGNVPDQSGRRLVAPAGICVDQLNNIFVATRTNISMFSSDGRYIKDVRKQDWALGLALSKNGQFCVTDRNGNIRLFTM